jgi:hypothetical protein
MSVVWIDNSECIILEISFKINATLVLIESTIPVLILLVRSESSNSDKMVVDRCI